ncbi:hypothetical protein CCACVL1_04496, partial [Corchorus capsularis]
DILLRNPRLRRSAPLARRKKETEASLKDACSRFAAVGSVKLASKTTFKNDAFG